MNKSWIAIFLFMLTTQTYAITSPSCNAYLDSQTMPKLLKLSPKSDPILREVMPDVMNFKDPELESTITDMCYSILPDQLKDIAAGMAANQWGIRKRIFIFTPDGSEPGNRAEIMINPSYTPLLRPDETEYKLVSSYEGCFSVPLAMGMINRYDAITATYFTPSGEKIVRTMEGYDARVFQHETDHLDGKLYDGRLDHFNGPECLERHTFNSAEEMDAWIEKERARRKAAQNK